MLTNFFENELKKKQAPKEGALYKVITAYGRSFEIRYGYYEEIDRQNPYVEPMEMYPNFIENPLYTEDGVPFVTAMQAVCGHFKLGRGENDEDNTCFHCTYFEPCEELLGVCRCKTRRKKE